MLPLPSLRTHKLFSIRVAADDKSEYKDGEVDEEVRRLNVYRGHAMRGHIM